MFVQRIINRILILVAVIAAGFPIGLILLDYEFTPVQNMIIFFINFLAVLIILSFIRRAIRNRRKEKTKE